MKISKNYLKQVILEEAKKILQKNIFIENTNLSRLKQIKTPNIKPSQETGPTTARPAKNNPIVKEQEDEIKTLDDDVKNKQKTFFNTLVQLKNILCKECNGSMKPTNMRGDTAVRDSEGNCLACSYFIINPQMKEEYEKWSKDPYNIGAEVLPKFQLWYVTGLSYYDTKPNRYYLRYHNEEEMNKRLDTYINKCKIDAKTIINDAFKREKSSRPILLKILEKEKEYIDFLNTNKSQIGSSTVSSHIQMSKDRIVKAFESTRILNIQVPNAEQYRKLLGIY